MQVNIPGADGSTQKKFKEGSVFIAEPQFFQMFNFSWLKQHETALSEPNTVLLTKDIAVKIFC